MSEKQELLEEEVVESRAEPGWLRKFPPLSWLLISLLIMVIVLPSSLNLPQANPSQVLEYAPVPPDDETPPSNEGSLSVLGLGSSSSLTTGVNRNPQIQPGEGGKGLASIVKKCVGKPLRQTEDPNAPPCVPYFEGDNGGNTYQGVYGDEIVVLIYQDTYCRIGGDGTGAFVCTPDPGQYCDVDSPPASEPGCLATEYVSGEPFDFDHFDVQVARALSRYFNERFQTYNRRVHYIIYWTSGGSAGARRAEAGANWADVKPFAVIQQPQFGGFDDVYTEAAVKRRMMVFGALRPRPNRYYSRLAPMVWNFWPDAEHQADNFVSYLCQQVIPFPVKHSGISGANGTPRKFGFLSTTDVRYPEYQLISSLVHQGIQSCGANIVDKRTHSRHQYSQDTHPDAYTEAQDNIASFKAKGVNAIIWSGGYDTTHGQAAEAQSPPYRPEIFVIGDQWHDSIAKARQQSGAIREQAGQFWSNARLMSNWLLENDQAEQPCRLAYYESDPQGVDPDRACEVYRSHFMLFKGIQLAGPFLHPTTVDQGQHSIPRQISTSPFVAACFYDPNDYTCVKDAREAWWDPTAPDPDGDPDESGCWRLINGGKRYTSFQWPGSDTAFENPTDPCDNQGNETDINPYGPTG